MGEHDDYEQEAHKDQKHMSFIAFCEDNHTKEELLERIGDLWSMKQIVNAIEEFDNGDIIDDLKADFERSQ